MTTSSALEKRVDALLDLARGIEDDHYPDPLDYVQALRMIVETAAGALPLAVQNAREHGATWDDVGKMLGTSRQAAWERFGR